MKVSVQDKVVIITGVCQGLGRAYAEAFAEEGGGGDSRYFILRQVLLPGL